MQFEAFKRKITKIKNPGDHLGPRSLILTTPRVDSTLPDHELAKSRRKERERLRDEFSKPRKGGVPRLYAKLYDSYIDGSTLSELYKQVICDRESTYAEQMKAWDGFRRTLCDTPLVFRRRLSREVAGKR